MSSFEVIVIGSGYGGIATASLLAKQGIKTLLLEAHSKIGGCASFFRKKTEDEQFIFDAGATTLSGVLDHQPLGKWFNAIGLKPNLAKQDPGMIISINGKNLRRYSKQEQWIEENQKFFSQDKRDINNLKNFWQEVYEVDKIGWDLLNENPNLPPSSIYDWIGLAKLSNFKGLKVASGLILNMDNILSKHGLNNNILFKKFINEQLLITAQSYSNTCPYLSGIMGLAYPAETYYPYGGITEPLNQAMEIFKTHGGEFLNREMVTEIFESDNGFIIKTNTGKDFQAKQLVSNIPIWNIAEIYKGNLEEYFQTIASKQKAQWSAFTINLVLEDKKQLETAYRQIHISKEIPFVDSKSFFVTISLNDDKLKSIPGWHSVTISTHSLSKHWLNLDPAEYLRRKEQTQSTILEEFRKALPEYADAEMKYISSGTAKTFLHYTKRYEGSVGGIPHDYHQPIILMPNQITPHPDLFMVGDTTFPGQGTASVVYGALKVTQHICSK